MKEYLAIAMAFFLTEAALGDPACTNLSDVVAASVSNSDAIKLKSTESRVAGAQAEAARAAVLPTLKAAGSVVRQDDSAISSSKTKPEDWQSTAKITLSQPLYAGGAEYATLRKSRILLEAAHLQEESSKLKVAREAVAKYFQILIAQAELRSITELRDVSRRRAKDIKNRVAIGRSRAADGLGADAQVATSEAQFEAAKLNVDAARRALASLTGGSIELACETPPQSKFPFNSLDELRAKLQTRPDIVAADRALNVAKENVTVARAGHQPSVDIGANYYLKRPESQASLGKWDIALSASLPLYAGGMVNAKVSESLAQESKQELESKLLKTAAIDEARELWEAYAASKSQLLSLEQAAEKSAKYYRMMAQDESKGLASSLEALQALNSSIDAQRAAQKARLRVDETWRQMILLTGTLEGVAP